MSCCDGKDLSFSIFETWTFVMPSAFAISCWVNPSESRISRAVSPTWIIGSLAYEENGGWPGSDHARDEEERLEGQRFCEIDIPLDHGFRLLAHQLLQGHP